MEGLERYTTLINEALANIDWPDQKLYDPMRYLLEIGGKRIRPSLTLIGVELAGGRTEDAVSQSVAIELFHNFSLMHDDIMDRADLRRGSSTVHKKWDEPTAILSGDGMMVMAYQYLIKEAFESTSMLIRIFSKMALDVCEGQMKDMDFESHTPSMDEYIDMIRQKTAVLLGAALQIGYLMGKDDEASASRLYHCGVNWGIAFQIKDDYLDLYGGDKSGKVVGGDILSNKKTVLHLLTLEKASVEDKQTLDEWFSIKDRTPEKISAVKSIYESYGAQDECLKLANRYFKKGNNLFNELVLPREPRKLMAKVAEHILQRDY